MMKNTKNGSELLAELVAIEIWDSFLTEADLKIEIEQLAHRSRQARRQELRRMLVRALNPNHFVVEPGSA
jgi:hypothetical protein